MANPDNLPIAFHLGHHVSVLFEFLPPAGAEYLTAKGTVQRQRLDIAVDTALAALKGVDTQCRLVFTLDLKESIDLRVGADDSSLEHGPNVVEAKTIARPDGGYDILTGAEWLVELDDSTPEVIDLRTSKLIHTVAHEAQHVRLLDKMAEAEYFGAEVALAPSEANAVHAMGILIDEYRCEVTANRFARTNSRAEDLEDQLAFFRSEMSLSYIEQQFDLAAGARRATIACHDMWKALAYLAAERAEDDDADALATPQPTPAEWNQYLAEPWTGLVEAVRLVPGADEEALDFLVVDALETLCKVFVSWMASVGFLLQTDEDGTESAYWLRDTF